MLVRWITDDCSTVQVGDKIYALVQGLEQEVPDNSEFFQSAIESGRCEKLTQSEPKPDKSKDTKKSD